MGAKGSCLSLEAESHGALPTQLLIASRTPKKIFLLTRGNMGIIIAFFFFWGGGEFLSKY